MNNVRFWAWNIWAHLIHPVAHTWVALEKDWYINDDNADDFDEWACWCCDAVRPR